MGIYHDAMRKVQKPRRATRQASLLDNLRLLKNLRSAICPQGLPEHEVIDAVDHFTVFQVSHMSITSYGLDPVLASLRRPAFLRASLFSMAHLHSKKNTKPFGRLVIFEETNCTSLTYIYIYIYK